MRLSGPYATSVVVMLVVGAGAMSVAGRAGSSPDTSSEWRAYGHDPGVPGNAYGIGNGNGPPENPGNGNGNAYGHDK